MTHSMPNMRAFTISLDSSYPIVFSAQPINSPTNHTGSRISSRFPSINTCRGALAKSRLLQCNCNESPSSSNSVDDDELDSEVIDDYLLFSDDTSDSVKEDGFHIEIEKTGKNTRRIQAKIAIDATLDTIWDILTDYEGLADFIPGLAVSKLIEKKDKFAKLYQIGQQNLIFGLKFNAKGIMDCFEKDLESFPSGKKRDIEFKMTEGDFQIFEGKWSIEEQFNKGSCDESDISFSQDLETSLSYSVDVKPKLWLPVRLVEGRLCQEIKMNLSCIRAQAQKTATISAHQHH